MLLIIPGATLAGHAVKKAVEKTGIDPAIVEDCLMGCAIPEKQPVVI